MTTHAPDGHWRALRERFRHARFGRASGAASLRKCQFRLGSGSKLAKLWCFGLHRLFFPVRCDSITNGDPLQALFSIIFRTPHGPTNRRRFEPGERQSPRTGNLVGLAVWQHFHLPTTPFPSLFPPQPPFVSALAPRFGACPGCLVLQCGTISWAGCQSCGMVSEMNGSPIPNVVPAASQRRQRRKRGIVPKGGRVALSPRGVGATCPANGGWPSQERQVRRL